MGELLDGINKYASSHKRPVYEREGKTVNVVVFWCMYFPCNSLLVWNMASHCGHADPSRQVSESLNRNATETKGYVMSKCFVNKLKGIRNNTMLKFWVTSLGDDVNWRVWLRLSITLKQKYTHINWICVKLPPASIWQSRCTMPFDQTRRISYPMLCLEEPLMLSPACQALPGLRRWKLAATATNKSCIKTKSFPIFFLNLPRL